MKRSWRAAVAAIALAAGLAGACSSSGSSHPLSGLEVTPPLQVGALSLPDVTTATAQPFALRAPAGDILAVYFGYTHCPDLCPTTMADLATARRLIGADGKRFVVAMITVDPKRDTPTVLTSWLRNFFGALATRVHALRTTDEAELSRVEKAFGATSEVQTTDSGDVEVSHTSLVALVDARGEVHLLWPFGITPAQMATDLRTLLHT